MGKIKTILMWIWFIILILIHLFLVVWIKVNAKEGIIFPIAMVIIWWSILIFVLVIKDKKDIKKKEKYKKDFVSEETIEDIKFGKVVFEKDSNTNKLYCKHLNFLFGKYNPEIEIYEYDERYKELYFRNLEKLYDNQEKILKDYYDAIKGFCDNWNEQDSNGNPISGEYIKENFDISCICIYKDKEEIIITLWGGFYDYDYNILGCHGVTAEIHCNSKEVFYDLVG